MNWLKAGLSFLFGGGSSGSVVEQAGKVADDLITSDEEKGLIDAADTASARAFAHPGNNPGVINQLVDAFNRIIRPGVTMWLIGGFSGWWTLPDIGTIDPVWFTIFTIVITFWFGGRALMQDVPKMIAAIIALRRRM